MFSELLTKYKNLNLASRMNRVRVIKLRTTLIAQKKELNLEGLMLLGDGASLADLVITRPELWIPSKNGLRIVKDKVVTTAFVTYICANLETEVAAFGDFKFHDSGIGVGDEAIGDTTLGTPWGGARTTGTQVPAAGVYTSVATTTYNASKAITEHGLFNINADGTLMDRTKFAAINVVDTNQIEFTFAITFTAGG